MKMPDINIFEFVANDIRAEKNLKQKMCFFVEFELKVNFKKDTNIMLFFFFQIVF